MILHPVILLVFLLQLVHRTAYRIPINEAESSAAREDDVLAQQDVKSNEGEKRYKRNCNVVPFDVQCHGRCPYTENEWNSMRRSWNCSNERDGATYHCTDPEDESGDPIEACGVPKYCDKGKGPVILFPQGHLKAADIDCKWCPEDYFNPSESIRSDKFSKCPESRNKCGRRGQKECDIVTGVKRHWTNSKCECDIKNNYFPLDGENKCTDQSLYCVGYLPCKKSQEGFDQIYIFSVSEGKYVCQRGCNESFQFKTPQSKNCEPVQVNNTTFVNETTIYDRSSLIPTTPEGTTTTSSPTTTKPHEEEDAGVSSGNELVFAVVLGCFSIIAIGCGCYYRNVKRTSDCKGNSRRKYKAKFQLGGNSSSSESNVQLQQEPLMSPPDVTDPIPHEKPGAPGVPKCKTTTEDSITLSWTPPNRDGGNPVTGYVLERREKGDDIWETSSCSVNQVTEFTIKDLHEGKEYEFRAAACNKAGTGEFSNCSEPIQVQSLQDTKRNMQDSYIFDGRLMLLDSDQIRRLEESLDKEAIGKGRIGTVYRCNNQEIFGITVAVKKIKTKEHSNQIRREKIVSRLMNPFLLPLLAVIEKSDEECWFIYPYCENGDLYDAIKRGKNEKDEKKKTKKININNQATRVKILLQIALAIENIHTKVPKVRGPILHKDIASKNVVLDKYLNARLIDFGLAREKDDDMSTLGGRKHYDHPKVGTGCDEDYFDFYSFGVIIREMLTSLGPEGEKNHFLKKMNSNQIEERLDKNVWKCKETRDKLKELSQKCLKEDAAWTIKDFKSNVVDKLRDIFLEFRDEIFENGGESTCHQCIINPIVSADKSSLINDDANCRQKIKVCMACEKNSFLNPITCYCGAKLKSAIGSNWGALLVAGDDDNPGKAAVMKKEILELERLVTSQAPRIIGIRQHNVKTVVPSENNVEKITAWTQIQKHIKAFSEDEEIDTLLIYFSCHGESSAEGNMFHLGKKEYISSDDFQKELDKLKEIDQLIIFLDRCFPPMVKFTDRKFIQINACSDKDAAVLKEEGSLFTKYVIQGLKARSEERECSKDCQHCVDYWKPKTEYISVFALFDYVNNHLQRKAPKPHWQGKGVGKNIAFFTGEVVEIKFTSKDEKSEKRYAPLPLSYLKHFDELRERLLEAFEVDQRTHEVKIQKETFRQDQPYDECDTLEKVMQAWLQRLPLVVTFTAQSINLRNEDLL